MGETLRILLIGEVGSGKTTLLKNILGCDTLLQISGEVKPPCSDILGVVRTVESVHIALYDSLHFGGANSKNAFRLSRISDGVI